MRLDLFKNILKKDMGIGNITDDFFALCLKDFFDNNKKGILLVVPTLFEANKLYDVISNYIDDCLLYPMDDHILRKAINIENDYLLKRLDVLNTLVVDNKKIVVTNLEGYLTKLLDKETYLNKFINLKVGQSISIRKLMERLINLGYSKELMINKTGEIAVRGFVIDVFPMGEENPIRLEFFGDEIESIRYFDVNTQKSIEKISNVCIKPLFTADAGVKGIFDYIEDCTIIYKDYNQIRIAYEKLLADLVDVQIDEKEVNLFELDEVFDDKAIHYLDFDSKLVDVRKDILYLDAKPIENLNGNFSLLNKLVADSIVSKNVILCLDANKIKRMRDYIEFDYVVTDINNLHLGKVNVVNMNLINGFSYGNYLFITEHDIFKQKKSIRHSRSMYKFATKISNVSKLEIGDYVVHNIYGIGIYNGLTTLTKNGMKKDYLEISYLKGDKLYIPVEKISLIGKYASKDSVIPKINSLSGSEWKKTKERVKGDLENISREIILMQARRKMQKGFKFSEDSNLQMLFESEFKYELTPDQIKVVEEIKKDMESTIPMDRLLCGDVGYGKTEVAFRAMFKAVLDSKQVLYLCPTTILSKQVYELALERFKNFPIKIGLLNRFVSPKEKKMVLEGLENSSYDIVIGTHRLLSDDIKPKDLGLLVIDEEQRFGVVHKEKIKKYKANIDILTLSATPIPRTLQMATIGLKDLSMITTPPSNRLPVQTYVIEENDYIIRNVVYKEVGRGGQVFILYNRIADIDDKFRSLSKIIPDVKMTFAHGRMTSAELEDRIYSFVNGEYDVLLCTTIIENGIDIPNANSLIILDADKLGLSQLYQLRGRVGRSDKLAYAYLMYDRNKVLNEIAIKRLKAIKEYTELGSGFGIASKDLAIRGAGDILGSEQAGFIEDIGVELYFKMLNAAVAKLKGEEVSYNDEEDYKPPLYNVDTHISDNYVLDDEIKIEIHKKINEIDSYEKLLVIKEEIEDRFGKISEEMLNYMYEEWFEKLARKNDVIEVTQKTDYVEIVFSKSKSIEIDYQDLFSKSVNISRNFSFKYKNGLFYLRLLTRDLEKDPLYYLNNLLKDL